MTAGPALAHRSKAPRTHNQASREYFNHSSASRLSTDALIVDKLRKEYPELHLTVVPVRNCDLLGYAADGHAGVAPIDNEKDRLVWRNFVPPPTRLNGGKGVLADLVYFAKYLLDWQGKEYVMYVIHGSDGSNPYMDTVNQYILSPSVEATEKLLLVAGVWHNELHEEVWVFDQGWWQKSRELFDSVQKASWDDVILEESMKNAIINDVDTFFDSRDTYERLRVPWKRGVIYYGPPGNGKTISIKAMMHMLYKRKPQIPTLYVKSLANFFGIPEISIDDIFRLARRSAPCYLVFEDLDSLVTDDVRSYFLVRI